MNNICIGQFLIEATFGFVACLDVAFKVLYRGSKMMYGRYIRQLENVETNEYYSEKEQEKFRLQEDKARKKELRGRGRQGTLAKYLKSLWRHTFAKLGEDWVFLALLGVIMALVSFLMDRGIALCNEARLWLYKKAAYSLATQYVAWVSLPVILILFSSGLAQFVAPQSIGSGIPEMKTILRGVALKEYLTFRTLMVKVIGLTATLGSGIPVGKEGPFVHIASMSATLLGKLITRFQGIYQNESRATEMLAAACAVGVASCFAAPVGGVLFSIEVTTVYFAVRNYWRGFFAAVCGATTFRLLAVWFQKADTVTAVFKTNFYMDFPFDPQELFVFALIGAICGVGGAFFVWIHRRYVMFMNNSKLLNFLIRKNRLLYPGIVTLIVSSLTFPPGVGQFIGGELMGNNQVVSLFTNFTWTGHNATIEEEDVTRNWTTPWTDVVANLTLYTIFTFIASVICTTVPVPSGIFIPVFKIGAGFGRMIGELMHIWFPTGMRYGGNVAKIIPGGYATVGAAAFSGSVTHTISVSVIVFEMTGQITHIIPIMIAVLISNAIASQLAPSIYDSIISIKNLPYIPDLLPSSSGIYKIYVEDFMIRDVKYISHGMSYKELESVLKKNSCLQSFPLVDKPESMVLLGSVQRFYLVQLMDNQIGRQKRLQVAAIRKKQAEEESREDGKRRPSLLKKQMSENQLNQTIMYNSGSGAKRYLWRKANSFTFRGFSPFASTNSVSNPYQTATVPENRIRQALESIFSRSSNVQDVDDEASQNLDNTNESLNNKIDIIPTNSSRDDHLSKEVICDMDLREKRQWEEEQLTHMIDFSACHIDPAPFQLVEQTSLLKTHFLFSMVGVKYGYVTAIGKLVGVVGLKELRKAIEDANSGVLPESDCENDEETFCIDDIKDCSVEQEPDANSTLLSKDSQV